MNSKQIIESIIAGVIGTAVVGFIGLEGAKVGAKINAKMNADVRTSFAQESMDRTMRRSADAQERIAAALEKLEERWGPLPRPSVLKEESCDRNR